MRIIRSISIIGLAAYLVLQGLYYIAAASSPILHAIIGIIGLVTGVLMFISITYWINHNHHHRRP